MKYVVENGNIHEYQEGKYENAVIFPTVEEAQEYVEFKKEVASKIDESQKTESKSEEFISNDPFYFSPEQLDLYRKYAEERERKASERRCFKWL